MIAKIRNITSEFKETVDDAIKDSELEDIKKEISLSDPDFSNNLFNNSSEEKKVKNLKENAIENKSNLSHKENPLIYWHLLSMAEPDFFVPLKTERAAAIAIQSRQLCVPGSKIRWSGSICLMCGELFTGGQAVGVDWFSEEEKIYRQLSIILEPN